VKKDSYEVKVKKNHGSIRKNLNHFNIAIENLNDYLHTHSLNESELKVLIEFYLNKLQDRICIEQTIEGIHDLLILCLKNKLDSRELIFG
jgi:hypothetical protein